jgi:hypothetical protein
MKRHCLLPLAATALLAFSGPSFAQTDVSAQSSGGATSSGTVPSGGAASGGAASQGASSAEAPAAGALAPGEAAGPREAGSLSTAVLLSVGAVGLIVGVVLVTFNHGNGTITTAVGTGP